MSDVLVVIGRVPVDYISAPGSVGSKVLLANNTEIGRVDTNGKLAIPVPHIDDLFIYPVQQKNNETNAVGGVCVVRYETETNINRISLPRVDTVLQPNGNPEATDLEQATDEIEVADALSGTKFYLVKINNRIVQAIFLGAEPQATELSVYDPLPAVEGTTRKGYNINNERITDTNLFKFDDVDYVINGTPIAAPFSTAIGAPILVPVALHAITTHRGSLPFVVERKSAEDTIIKGPQDATWTFPDGHTSTGDLVLTGSINGHILLTAKGGRKVALQVITKEELTLRCVRCDQRYTEARNVHGSCQWHTRHAQEINQIIEEGLTTVNDLVIPGSEDKAYSYYLNRVSDWFSSEVERKIDWLERQDPTRVSLVGSPKDMILSDLRKLVVSYRGFTNLEDQSARNYARVVVHLLDQRRLEDCLKLPYYDPNDPDQRMTAGVRNPNKRYGLSEDDVWQCCGYSAEQPGCWVGRHSQSVYPELQDILTGVRGTEYLNDPNTSEESYQAIVEAKENQDWKELFDLENAFNTVHGGVLEVAAGADPSVVAALSSLNLVTSPDQTFWHRSIQQSLKYDGFVGDLFSQPKILLPQPETKQPKAVKPKKKEFTRFTPGYVSPSSPQKEKKTKETRVSRPEERPQSEDFRKRLDAFKADAFFIRGEYYVTVITTETNEQNLAVRERKLEQFKNFKFPDPDPLFVNYKKNVLRLDEYLGDLGLAKFNVNWPLISKTDLQNFLGKLFRGEPSWMRTFARDVLIHTPLFVLIDDDPNVVFSNLQPWGAKVHFDEINTELWWPQMIPQKSERDRITNLLNGAIKVLDSQKNKDIYDDYLIVWKAFVYPSPENVSRVENLLGILKVFEETQPPAEPVGSREEELASFQQLILTKVDIRPFLFDLSNSKITLENLERCKANYARLVTENFTTIEDYEAYEEAVENFFIYVDRNTKKKIQEPYEPSETPLELIETWIGTMFSGKLSVTEETELRLSILRTPVEYSLENDLDPSLFKEWKIRIHFPNILAIRYWPRRSRQEKESRRNIKKFLVDSQTQLLSIFYNFLPGIFVALESLWKAIFNPSIENRMRLSGYLEQLKNGTFKKEVFTVEERIAALKIKIQEPYIEGSYKFTFKKTRLNEATLRTCERTYEALTDMEIPSEDKTPELYKKTVLNFVQYVKDTLGADRPLSPRFKSGTESEVGNRLIEASIENRETKDIVDEICLVEYKIDLSQGFSQKVHWKLRDFINPGSFLFWDKSPNERVEALQQLRVLHSLIVELGRPNPKIVKCYELYYKTCLQPSDANFMVLREYLAKLKNISTFEATDVKLLQTAIKTPLRRDWRVFYFEKTQVTGENYQVCLRNFDSLKKFTPRNSDYNDYKAAVIAWFSYVIEVANTLPAITANNVYKGTGGGTINIDDLTTAELAMGEALLVREISKENQDGILMSEVDINLATLDSTRIFNKFDVNVIFQNLLYYNFWKEFFGINNGSETSYLLELQTVKLTGLIAQNPAKRFEKLLVLWKSYFYPNKENLDNLQSIISALEAEAKATATAGDDTQRQFDEIRRKLAELLAHREIPEKIRKYWPREVASNARLTLRQFNEKVVELENIKNVNEAYFRAESGRWEGFFSILDHWNDVVNEVITKIGTMTFVYDNNRANHFIPPAYNTFDEKIRTAKITDYGTLQQALNRAKTELIRRMVNRNIEVPTENDEIANNLLEEVNISLIGGDGDTLEASALFKHTQKILASVFVKTFTLDQQRQIDELQKRANDLYRDMQSLVQQLQVWLPIELDSFELPTEKTNLFNNTRDFWNQVITKYIAKNQDLSQDLNELNVVIEELLKTEDLLVSNPIDIGIFKSNWKKTPIPKESTLEGYKKQLAKRQKIFAQKLILEDLKSELVKIDKEFNAAQRGWRTYFGKYLEENVVFEEPLDEISQQLIKITTVDEAYNFLNNGAQKAIEKVNKSIDNWVLLPSELHEIQKYFSANIKIFDAPGDQLPSRAEIQWQDAVVTFSGDVLSVEIDGRHVITDVTEIAENNEKIAQEEADRIESMMTDTLLTIMELQEVDAIKYEGLIFIDNVKDEANELYDEYEALAESGTISFNNAFDLYKRVSNLANNFNQSKGRTLRDLVEGVEPFQEFTKELLLIETLNSVAYYPGTTRETYLKRLQATSEWSNSKSTLKEIVKTVLETGSIGTEGIYAEKLREAVFGKRPYKFSSGYEKSPEITAISKQPWWPKLFDILIEDKNGDHENLLAIYRKNIEQMQENIQAGNREIIKHRLETGLKDKAYLQYVTSEGTTEEEVTASMERAYEKFGKYLQVQFTFVPPRSYEEYVMITNIGFLNRRLNRIQRAKYKIENDNRALFGLKQRPEPETWDEEINLVDVNEKALNLIQRMQVENLFDQGFVEYGDGFVQYDNLYKNCLLTLASLMTGHTNVKNIEPCSTTPLFGNAAWWVLLQILKPTEFASLYQMIGQGFTTRSDLQFAESIQLEYTLNVSEKTAILGVLNSGDPEAPYAYIYVKGKIIRVVTEPDEGEELKIEIITENTYKVLQALQEKLRTLPKFAYRINADTAIAQTQEFIFKTVFDKYPESLNFAFWSSTGTTPFGKRRLIAYAAHKILWVTGYWKPAKINSIIKSFYWTIVGEPENGLDCLNFQSEVGEVENLQNTGSKRILATLDPRDEPALQKQFNAEFYELFGLSLRIERIREEDFGFTKEIPAEESQTEEKEPIADAPEVEENNNFVQELKQRTNMTLDQFNEKFATAKKMRSNIYWNWQQANEESGDLGENLSSINYNKPPSLSENFLKEIYYRNLRWMLTFADVQFKRSSEETDQEVLEKLGSLYGDKKTAFVEWDTNTNDIDYKFELDKGFPVIYMPFPLRDIELVRLYYAVNEAYDSQRFHIRSTLMADQINIGSSHLRMWNSRLSDSVAITSAINYLGELKIPKNVTNEQLQEILLIDDPRITTETVKKFRQTIQNGINIKNFKDLDVAMFVLYINGLKKTKQHIGQIQSFFRDLRKNVGVGANFLKLAKNNITPPSKFRRGDIDQVLWQRIEKIAEAIKPKNNATEQALSNLGPDYYTASLLANITDEQIENAYIYYYHERNIGRFLSDSIENPEDSDTVIYAVSDSDVDDVNFQNVGHGIALHKTFKNTLERLGNFTPEDKERSFEMVELVSRRKISMGRPMYALMIIDFIVTGYEYGGPDPFTGFNALAWLDLDTTLELRQEPNVFVEVTKIPVPQLAEAYSKWGLKPTFPKTAPISLLAAPIGYRKADVVLADTWLAAYLSGALYDKPLKKPSGAFVQPSPSKLFGENAGKFTKKYLQHQVKLTDIATEPPELEYNTTDNVPNPKESPLFYKIKDRSIRRYADDLATPIIRNVDPKDYNLLSVRNPGMYIEFTVREGTIQIGGHQNHVDWLKSLFPEMKSSAVRPQFSPRRPRSRSREPKKLTPAKTPKNPPKREHFNPELVELGRLAAQRLQELK